MSVIALDHVGVAKRLRVWVTSLARQKGVKPSDVENVTQDILTATVASKVECNGLPENVLEDCEGCAQYERCVVWAIVGGIANHKVLDYLREQYKRKEVSFEDTGFGVSGEADAFSPHDNNDLVGTVTDALAQLPADERMVVLLRYFCRRSFTFEQIGNALGVSAGTAHNRHRSALTVLKRIMDKHEGGTCSRDRPDVA